MIRLLFFFTVFYTSVGFAGFPPTTSKVSGDSAGIVTFNYQFPNFTGTHTGSTISLSVNSIAGGGTGQATQSAAFDALSPMTTGGDLIYGGASGTGTRLANGSSGQVLTSSGGTSAPTWTSLVGKGTGEVFMTAKTSCPTGSIAADGTSELRTGGTGCGGGSCATLFAAISTTYGSADGTHFTLPNVQGVFVRGAGSQTISAISYAGTQGTTQGDQMQGHKHNQNVEQTFQTTSGSGLLVPYSGNVSAFSGATSSPISDGTNGTPRTGSENRPANIVLLYCIVY